MNVTPEIFEAHLLETDIFDPHWTHREFKSGMHGQEANLGEEHLPPGSELYDEYVDVNVGAICGNYLWPKQNGPLFVIGVANGTNRLAVDVGEKVPGAIGFETEKDADDNIHLTRVAKRAIEVIRPNLAVVVENVGTTGGSALQVAEAILEAGARHVVVQVTLQRRERLERLDDVGIRYRSIIKRILPTYTPEECNDHGFCAHGWYFIPREA